MRKLILTSSILVALGGATSVSAQDLEYDLSAEVAEVCMVNGTASYTGEAQFGDLTDVATGNWVESDGTGADYVCNAPNGFTREITSQNGGMLVRDGSGGGPNNEIAYEMKHGGGSGLGFGWTDLNAAKTDSFNASGAFLDGQTGTVRFRAEGVENPNNPESTTVYAGDYSDLVTISVTAN